MRIHPNADTEFDQVSRALRRKHAQIIHLVPLGLVLNFATVGRDGWIPEGVSKPRRNPWGSGIPRDPPDCTPRLLESSGTRPTTIVLVAKPRHVITSAGGPCFKGGSHEDEGVQCKRVLNFTFMQR